jgi:hypothetical protein
VVVVQLITVNSTVMRGRAGKMKPERKMAQNFF